MLKNKSMNEGARKDLALFVFVGKVNQQGLE